MEFSVALTKVYKTMKKEQLADPFLVFCKLSDLIGDSYNDKKKSELYYKVSTKVNLFVLAENKGRKSKKIIAKKYPEVQDVVSFDTFNKIIDIVYGVVYPSNKKPAKPPKTEVVQKAVVKKIKTKSKTETKTPLGKKTLFGGCSSGVKRVIRMLFNLIGVSLALLTVGAVINGMIFAIKTIPWSVWQWIIGVSVSVALCVIVFKLGIWFDNEYICNYYAFGTFALYFFAVSNFLLKVLFAGYSIVFFTCASIPIIVLGCWLAYKSFDYLENGWGWAQIIAVILNCILSTVVFILYYL